MKNSLIPAMSVRQIYQLIVAGAGSQSKALKRSLLLSLLAALTFGLALALLYPFFTALLSLERSLSYYWLMAITALMLTSAALRWFALDYDYSGHMGRGMHELRNKLGDHLRQIPLEKLYQHRAGDLVNTLAGNVDEALSFTLFVANIMIFTIVVPLTVALVSLFYDWRIALVLLLLLLALLPLNRWRTPINQRNNQILAAANANLNAELIEYIQGLPVLRAANCSGKQAEKLQAAIHEVRDLQALAQRKNAIPSLLIGAVMELGIVLLVLLGIFWVWQGTMSVILVAAISVAAVRFNESLANFVLVASIYQLIYAAYARIQALLTIKPLPQLAPTQLPQQFDITFEQLSYSYETGIEPALQDINLTLPANSMTALVGPSGCGKTTLARMIMRYADPQQGRVLIGGVDIKHIPAEQLMALIAVVFQEVYLFDDSILNNIRMGRSDADDAAVYRAAQQAQCHDFILSLPQGYQTKVGEIGASLSGGERQRISIARALLKDAPIVILDEPTASLDSENEVAVQQAIDILVRNKTLLVISHRLSTIVAANNIVVMQQQRIIEQGNHTALLAQQQRYWQLWQAQLSVKDWQPPTQLQPT